MGGFRGYPTSVRHIVGCACCARKCRFQKSRDQGVQTQTSLKGGTGLNFLVWHGWMCKIRLLRFVQILRVTC